MIFFDDLLQNGMIHFYWDTSIQTGIIILVLGCSYSTLDDFPCCGMIFFKMG